MKSHPPIAPPTRAWRRWVAVGPLWGLLCLLAACAALLPDEKKETKTPWKSYAEAERVFTGIVPNKTTLTELKAMGIDPTVVPNVMILSHSDLLRRLEAMVYFEGTGLDPAIKKCVASRQNCFAYRLEQQSIERERVGGFWTDFLNFRRITNVTGWQFDALILISNDVVVYKSWSGKPNIREVEQEHHPLGPLQGLGSSVR